MKYAASYYIIILSKVLYLCDRLLRAVRFHLNEGSVERLLSREYTRGDPFYDQTLSLLTAASDKLQSGLQSTVI